MKIAYGRFWTLSAVLMGVAGCDTLANAPATRMWAPAEGTRAYRYAGKEVTPGQPDRGYRVDFDLSAGGRHTLTAIVRRAIQTSGDVMTPALLDDACKQALHAGRGELARVTLVPLSKEASDNLGDAFMAPCAPAAIFFPMTDILNVALVQSDDLFGLAKLRAPGDSARFTAFETKLDRFGTAITASSPGGEIRFVSEDQGRATIDWLPDPMKIEILNRKLMNGADLVPDGYEHYAFRVVIDTRTGALVSAVTPYDQLDLTVHVPGMPAEKAPKLTIKRDVAISSATAP